MRPWLVLLVFVSVVMGASGLDDPFSTKIWDDPSLSNLSTKGHTALGYATVTLGTTSFVLASMGQPVPFVGDAAAVTAGTTVLAGLVAHWDELSFDGDWLTWHNLHGMTAATGATLVMAAPFLGPRNQPSYWGLSGVLLLTLAIMFEG